MCHDTMFHATLLKISSETTFIFVGKRQNYAVFMFRIRMVYNINVTLQNPSFFEKLIYRLQHIHSISVFQSLENNLTAFKIVYPSVRIELN